MQEGMTRYDGYERGRKGGVWVYVLNHIYLTNAFCRVLGQVTIGASGRAENLIYCITIFNPS